MLKKTYAKNIALVSLLTITILACKQEKKDTIKTSENTGLTTAKNQPLIVNKIDSTQFPKSIKYEGFIKNAVRWKDNSGDNIVITTETGYHINKKFKHESDDSSDAELFGYHFIISGNEAKQTWRIYDYISDCPVDIVASFVKNTFKITDLDKNGTAEIWLMYKTVCHGDVSPCDMKIIMYEGNQKYAMRGENKVQVGVDDNGKKQSLGGEYKFDKNFKKAPKVFKKFAEDLWNKNIIENWDN
ncbi:M949_RS01915 family surface polysaccharide biosynthesis protein [Flavobacterium sp.]|uniref:M949_RS01915 family surface polysaccharide biosynthesis protein n=1 Tax=Flavobacterium sp. TaxID=239 RepID=UPI003D13B914